MELLSPPFADPRVRWRRSGVTSAFQQRSVVDRVGEVIRAASSARG